MSMSAAPQPIPTPDTPTDAPTGPAADAPQPRRVELILRQIQTLPTLPAVATQLLQLTTSDDSNAQQVVDLISADPTLTAKVLQLCRTTDRAVDRNALTVDKAVVLLGFTAIRNAVLSVKVYEVFADHREDSRFDRPGFWVHSLAVAIAAEELAKTINDPAVVPAEAFVCGLLHDLGKLALDHVLPKAYGRCLELAETHLGTLAEYERKVIGIDHHAAGRRLAEQWQLPHKISDTLWLHGTPIEAMPELAHRRLIAVVGLADLIARRQHLGFSGNRRVGEDPAAAAKRAGILPLDAERVAAQLHELVEDRGQRLGLHNHPTRELFLQSIQQANASLGKLNADLDRRSRQSAAQGRVLSAINTFHAQRVPGQSPQDVIDHVARSARDLLGEGFLAVLTPAGPTGFAPRETPDAPAHEQDWLFTQYTPDADPLTSDFVTKPKYAPDLSRVQPDDHAALNLMHLLPWLAEHIVQADDAKAVRLLPLTCGWGTAGLLLHDRASTPHPSLLASVGGVWGAAVAAATQHDGAKRLGEQLADANTRLADAQEQLTRQASMTRLGEMAAGAAHEMNNPLAVISGRSQLLAQGLTPGSKEHKAALQIARETHRLSDLITSLHLFAEPPVPHPQAIDLGALIQDAVARLESDKRRRNDAVQVSVSVRTGVPPVHADPEHLLLALGELLLNAVQASPRSAVQVVALPAPDADAVELRVVDDGDGMNAHTINHALDPFFSNQPAGRRVGMGLTRAHQLIAAMGGSLRLRSVKGEGTTASLLIPLDSNQHPFDTPHGGRVTDA